MKIPVYLAIGCVEIYWMASATDRILSASLSGISIQNSSSIAITISTASKLSNERSSANRADGVSFAALT